MPGPILTLASGAATRRVELDAYLTGAQQDAAATAAGAWIKNVRNARVDGVPFRRRFTYRDDSLWWFAELYLHKQQVVLNIFKTVAALDALLDREQPSAIGLEQADPGIAPVVAQFAVARGVQFSGLNEGGPSLARLAAMDARASWLHAGALASRTRRHPIASRHRTASVLAFVHRAFWRTEADDGTAEQYIGPVLKALEGRLPDGGLQYVSVGPSANFRARRWWHPVIGDSGAAAAPAIEAFASLEALKPSRRLWRERHAFRRALWNSEDLRAMSQIRGCDCWSVLRHELAGVALLQWPWSARAMDEAAAALDSIGPSAGTDLRRGWWLGPRHRARVPAARDTNGGSAARLHLQALAQLPARAGRDRRRPRPPRRLRIPAAVGDAALRRVCRAPSDPGRPLPETDAARHRQPTTGRPRSLDAQPFASRSGAGARRDAAHVSQTPWSLSRPSGRKRGRSCPSSCMRPPACPVFASRSRRIRPKRPMRT